MHNESRTTSGSEFPMRFGFVGNHEIFNEFIEHMNSRIAKFGHIEWVSMYTIKYLHSGVFRGEVVITNKTEYNKAKITDMATIVWLESINDGSVTHATRNDYIFRHKVPPSQFRITEAA